MNVQNIKTEIRKNFIYYFAGFLVIFGLKLFYSKADCNMLKWILTPTARWVSILSSIPFWYESGMGYVNYGLRFVIAPSCSGVSFMIITMATLIFSFAYRFDGLAKKFGWMAGSIAFSYLFTVFINGLRIILAIYIPLSLEGMNIYGSYLTPERLHTLIGTAVYFTALLTIYHLADCLFKKDSVPHSRTLTLLLKKSVSPVFWYFLIVLGIPFINRVHKNDYTNFADYAILITITCLAIISLLFLVRLPGFLNKQNQ